MRYVVVVHCTVDAPSPEEARALVRRELDTRLRQGGGATWHTALPILPRYEIIAVDELPARRRAPEHD
jgi:hypothetical protein